MGDKGLWFKNIMPGSDIIIYNLNAELVYKSGSIAAGGRWFWDISSLNPGITSGIYVYMIVNSSRNEKGKLYIFR